MSKKTITDPNNEWDLQLASNLHRYAQAVRDHAASFNFEWDIRAVDWPQLNQDSVVVEVGGYTGRWSLQIADRYKSNMIIFEPQVWCCVVMEEVFEEYKAKIYPFGLAMKDSEEQVTEFGTDGCTVVPRSYITGLTRALVFKEIHGVFYSEGLKHIDMMMINIEGGEFTLIPHMLKVGILPEILMVQFHGPEKMLETRKDMNKYYIPIWDYSEALSAWKLK